MTSGNQVRLPDGTMRYIADNQRPYHLNCPIDGTQLVETSEYDFNAFSCVTCGTFYQTRRGEIDQDELNRQAIGQLRSAKKRISELGSEKEKLEKLLEIGEKTLGVIII